METKYLIINPGSTSKKYAVYDGENELYSFHLEKEGNSFIYTSINSGKKSTQEITSSIYKNPYKYIFQVLLAAEVIRSLDDIKIAAIRIVASGSFFLQNRYIDDEYVAHLHKALEVVPLHISHILEEINQLHQTLPNIRCIGISDSAFHNTKPEVSKHYAIPQAISQSTDLYRFGYHGISIQSILTKIQNNLTNIPLKIIVCHLGGGASVTAICDGKSIDNSMGFSPLEGLYMATRSGSMDPSAVMHLFKSLNLSPSEFESFLNTKCGLLGLSGKSDDIRQLIDLESNEDMASHLALETYIYQIKKYIGSYIAILNGLDMMIFTGTVGERSSIIRSRVCENLECFGIKLNTELNNKVVSKDAFINDNNSPVKVVVMNTEEMKEIAYQARLFVNNF